MYSSIILIGTVATALLDLWSLLRRKLTGAALPDYGLVGRWIGHIGRGQFRHSSIKSASPVPGERAIGWISHYAIGIGFSFLLPIVGGESWLEYPTLPAALLVGVSTVLAPFLIMQPGMGAGIAARHTPNPDAARRQSVITHSIFGIGLYAAAVVINMLKGV